MRGRSDTATDWEVDDSTSGLLAAAVRGPLGAVALCSSLVAAAVTLIATRRGPGLTPDSTHYLSAGLNLANGNGLRSFNGEVLTIFPPALPTVVAVGRWLGLTAEWTVRLFNAGVIAAIVLLGFVLLRRHLRSAMLVGISTVLLAVSVPLHEISRMAWTEPAFVAICLAFLLILERHIATPQSAMWSLAAVTLVWAAFLFRYSGIALVAVGAISLFIGARKARWRVAFISASVFAVLSVLVPLGWMIRNHSVDQTLLGPRADSADGLVVTSKRFLLTIGGWAIPEPAPAVVQGVAVQGVAGVLVVLLGSGAALLLAARGVQRAATGGETEASPIPLLTFVVVYSVYLVAAQLATAIDALDSRLMSPLFVPVVVLAGLAIERVCAIAPPDWQRWIRLVVGALLILFVAGQALVLGRMARASAIQGRGYAKTSWQQSGLVSSASDLPLEAMLYSNRPDGLWAVLRREPIMLSPAKGAHRSTEVRDISPEFLAAIECQANYLVWFDRSRDYLFTPEELSEHVQLEIVSTSRDGTLYRMRSLPSADGSC